MQSLSFCSSLWNWLLEPAAAVSNKHVAEAVLRMLQHDGVNVWRLRKLNSTAEEAARHALFTGGAAERVMARFDAYMEVLGCKKKDKGQRFTLVFES